MFYWSTNLKVLLYTKQKKRFRKDGWDKHTITLERRTCFDLILWKLCACCLVSSFPKAFPYFVSVQCFKHMYMLHLVGLKHNKPFHMGILFEAVSLIGWSRSIVFTNGQISASVNANIWWLLWVISLALPYLNSCELARVYVWVCV